MGVFGLVAVNRRSLRNGLRPGAHLPGIVWDVGFSASASGNDQAEEQSKRQRWFDAHGYFPLVGRCVAQVARGHRLLTIPFRAQDSSGAKKKAHKTVGLSKFESVCAYARELSMPLQASTRPLTAFTEVSNISCSSLLSLMFTTFSTPPAPITVGTPTYMSFTPRSPSQ